MADDHGWWARVNRPLPPQRRRQLEVCIVAILRVVYWAQGLVQAMPTRPSSSPPPSSQVYTQALLTEQEEQQRQQQDLYLQARWGCKAILTGKLGKGASGSVLYLLSTLQVSDCLRDLIDYAVDHCRDRAHRDCPWALVPDQCLDFREALAAVVEFDGLDALTDPSPRTALTVAQYTPDKARWVERCLAEQVVPRGQRLVRTVEREHPAAVQRSKQYIQDYYANEVPVLLLSSSLSSEGGTPLPVSPSPSFSSSDEEVPALE